MSRRKIIRLLIILFVITFASAGLLKLMQLNSMSLDEYAKLNNTQSDDGSSSDNTDGNDANENGGADGSETEKMQDPTEMITPVLPLTGASLNGDSQLGSRTTHAEGFYYEPLSDSLRQYMTGISYPETGTQSDAEDSHTSPGEPKSAQIPEITLDELRYVHILHYDFDGNPAEGELICNEAIAQDLVEIFYELYGGGYRLERVRLIDEYGGDDTASIEANNTSCFNYRVMTDSAALSLHAYGLAVDINPLYNPYIANGNDGAANVPVGEGCADRSLSFPYKIDEEDLCYQLFTRHGFTWGGSWESPKDYQHFEKPKP